MEPTPAVHIIAHHKTKDKRKYPRRDKGGEERGPEGEARPAAPKMRRQRAEGLKGWGGTEVDDDYWTNVLGNPNADVKKQRKGKRASQGQDHHHSDDPEEGKRPKYTREQKAATVPMVMYEKHRPEHDRWVDDGCCGGGSAGAAIPADGCLGHIGIVGSPVPQLPRGCDSEQQQQQHQQQQQQRATTINADERVSRITVVGCDGGSAGAKSSRGDAGCVADRGDAIEVAVRDTVDKMIKADKEDYTAGRFPEPPPRKRLRAKTRVPCWEEPKRQVYSDSTVCTRENPSRGQ